MRVLCYVNENLRYVAKELVKYFWLVSSSAYIFQLKRLWDKHHTESGWNFRVHCADKVRQIFTAGTSLSNYIHFCRLFVDQLLLSCIKGDLCGICIVFLEKYLSVI